ncbi:CBS domain-containing protein, partial [bacterium]|nr:CBS domain-containing protein [bacterium]
WVDDSVLDIYREDITRYKILFAVDIEEDAGEAVEAGRAPRLSALRLHNGTVYRWNRACYGVLDGKPHLRIENRVLPSGPTVIDEVANAAFWFGLMSGMGMQVEDVRTRMQFDDAKDNFFSAARHGLAARFQWLDGKRYAANDLILQELLPMARDGLRASDIDSDDVTRYLDVIEERVKTEQTGANWLVQSLARMDDPAPTWEKLHALTAAMVKRQQTGEPVHTWSPAVLQEGGGWKSNYLRVDQYMITDLFTVGPDEPIDLVANMMLWNRIRHIMVEDARHHLLGLVSHRNMLRLVGQPIPQEEGHSAPVSTVMVKDPITVSPETLTLDAIRIMREKRISCLPVVKEGKLIGVVTEDRFLAIAANLLEQKLRE